MAKNNFRALTIQCTLKWIEENLSEQLTTDMIAEYTGYSKWHLQRIFKLETGMSIGAYIRKRKLTEIAQKLKSNDETILDLAFQYGFNSQQTLTRSFKNQFGLPPLKYRMQCYQENAEYLHPLLAKISSPPYS